MLRVKITIARLFAKVSAIILGKHEQFDDCKSNRRPIDVLMEILPNNDIPILYDFDCCHTHPMLTMPLGDQVRINFDEETIELI